MSIFHSIFLILIIMPMIIGIISVDINGDRFNIREFFDNLSDEVKDNVGIRTVERNLPLVETDETELDNTIIITDSGNIDKMIEKIRLPVMFFSHHASEFGIWMGESTAPFHYILAILITFTLVYPIFWIWIVACFTVLIKERKEIFRVAKHGIHDADLKNYCREIKNDIRLVTKKRFKRTGKFNAKALGGT